VIHNDIVKIWNFTDPDEILSGANFRKAIRTLFLEPLLSPELELGKSPHASANQSHMLETLTKAILNPAEGAASALEIGAEVLDQVALTTPATARALMAYVADLTLGMESLFWLVRPRENKAITRQDVVQAYMTYYQTSSINAVHMAVRDYIGDEQLMKSFKRDKAAEKVKSIVEKNRFNPKTIFTTEHHTQ